MLIILMLRPRRPRRTEGDFQFDKAPGWAMPNCSTTQKLVVVVVVVVVCVCVGGWGG